VSLIAFFIEREILLNLVTLW